LRGRIVHGKSWCGLRHRIDAHHRASVERLGTLHDARRACIRKGHHGAACVWIEWVARSSDNRIVDALLIGQNARASARGDVGAQSFACVLDCCSSRARESANGALIWVGRARPSRLGASTRAALALAALGRTRILLRKGTRGTAVGRAIIGCPKDTGWALCVLGWILTLERQVGRRIVRQVCHGRVALDDGLNARASSRALGRVARDYSLGTVAVETDVSRVELSSDLLTTYLVLRSSELCKGDIV